MYKYNIDNLAKDCHNDALQAMGTSYIFLNRAKKYSFFIKLNTILGVLIPLIAGSLLLSYSSSPNILYWTVIILSPLTTFQLILSALSLVYKWDDIQTYSLKSAILHKQFAQDFKKMGEYLGLKANDSQSLTSEDIKNYKILDGRCKQVLEDDMKFSFSAKENRIAMRYGLWIYKTPCATCKKTPFSQTPNTNEKCDTCSNF